VGVIEACRNQAGLRFSAVSIGTKGKVSLMRRVFLQSLCAATVAAGMLSGCTSAKTKPTPENFKAGLSKYLAGKKLDCLFTAEQKFPYVSGDAAEQKRLNVMVDEQLLTVKFGQQVGRYDTTTYGARLAPRFCFGERTVTSIDGNTPLKVVDGFNQTTVSYHYSMADVPTWAKSDAMKKAFPAMAQATSGSASAQVAMAQTAVGWQVPE
jgi:hypothetical protein